MPTSIRDFYLSDDVNAFLRVHQGGVGALGPVTEHTRIRNDANAMAFENVETLPPDRFRNGRAADWWMNVPMARMKLGPHLLTVEVESGNVSVRRDVRFIVKR